MSTNFTFFQPSVIPVRNLLALEKIGGSSKSLQLLLTSEREREPEIYELEIMQPPTRFKNSRN
jgi:hypothetical protein